MTPPPYIPSALARLPELAHNIWWSWHPEARSLFLELDPPLWRRVHHNPVALLHDVSRARLDEAAADRHFIRHYTAVLRSYDDALFGRNTWCAKRHPRLAAGLVAYFSAEFGLHGSLPFYAGGLGLLAGDHVKEASDLGVPLVGVGFMYPQGYFHQHVNADGRQEEIYEQIDRQRVAVEPVLTPDGKRGLISLELPERRIHLGAWRVRVGRSELYLMDADLEENAPWDRELTGRLYGGDREVRLLQEILLGVGGMRLLRSLGLRPRVWHGNEGHIAMMMVERLREHMEAGLDFDRAVEAVRATTIFTTHTPVAAGHDAFPFSLAEKYVAHLTEQWQSLGRDREKLLAFAAHDEAWGPGFNMTALALQLSGRRNAVSRRHGVISRRMWGGLWPDVPESEVPIRTVTNGVHAPTWVAAEMNRLYRKFLGQDWMQRHDDPAMWARVSRIPDDALWRVRCELKINLCRFIKDRARQRWAEDRVDPAQVVAFGAMLDPQALTIGFGRRFATYKRATLVLRDVPRLKKILTDLRRPVQIIFAGKAHPADEPGKQLLRTIFHAAKDPALAGRIAFLEDYDMHVARYLLQGVDLWLNTPLPPMEASGTSGMKAALNGVPSLSILDGWWPEGYNGSNGWAIGSADPDGEAPEGEAADARDAEAMYRALEERVVPLFYDRSREGIPRGWLQVVRSAIQSIGPRFCARRMVKEYVEQLYLEALEAGDRSIQPPGKSELR